jgi:hypothetical protein
MFGDNLKEHIFASPGNYQRRPRPLNWLRAADRVSDLIVAAMETRSAICKHRFDDSARLVESAKALKYGLKLEPKTPMLLFEPACT